MIIDAHAHVGIGRYKSISPEKLLEEMDQNEVEMSVICPVEEQIVIRNREGNNFLLHLMDKYPKRFTGFAVSNPWYGKRAVSELERALSAGLTGVKFHPVVQGFSINDEIVFPLIDVASKRNVPIYVHTGTPHFGEPFKLVELARKYPETTFFMGHSGFSDFWRDLERCHRFAPNIYFETSRCVPSHLANLIKSVGIDYVIFGSNLPETLYPIEIQSVKEVVNDPNDQKKIFYSNFKKAMNRSL
jgi:predicted TIM-barrel fold metal-dependent hydrolase